MEQWFEICFSIILFQASILPSNDRLLFLTFQKLLAMLQPWYILKRNFYTVRKHFFQHFGGEVEPVNPLKYGNACLPVVLTAHRYQTSCMAIRENLWSASNERGERWKHIDRCGTHQPVSRQKKLAGLHRQAFSLPVTRCSLAGP